MEAIQGIETPRPEWLPWIYVRVVHPDIAEQGSWAAAASQGTWAVKEEAQEGVDDLSNESAIELLMEAEEQAEAEVTLADLLGEAAEAMAEAEAEVEAEAEADQGSWAESAVTLADQSDSDMLLLPLEDDLLEQFYESTPQSAAVPLQPRA